MNTIFTTQAPSTRTALSRNTAALSGLFLAASLAACGDPPVDSNSAAPTGIIRGTVQYIGRRVDCTYDLGVPVAVKGVLILTLLDNENPLPPEGTAQMPVDLKAAGGEDIFTDLTTDCLPEAGEPNPLAPVIIQRSYSFEWRRIPLGPPIPEGENPEDFGAQYRIVSTYDQRGDFNPLFDVTQAPNSGDVAGGAIENPLAAVPQFRVIMFDSESLAPLGQVREGINVTLGAVVATDAPLMRVLDGDLSSQTGWTGVLTANTGYPTFDLTLYGRTPAIGDRVELDKTLTALDLSSQVTFASPVAYAWYIEPIDVDHDGNTDCSNGLTDKDCHPLFGNVLGGIRWQTPVVFLQRAQNDIETASGVPSVAFIPASGVETTNRRAQYPNVRLRIFPVATLLTNPAVSDCRMLYFADGSNGTATGIGGFASALPAGTAMECSELPTGFYGTNVLTGFAIQSSAQVATEGNDAVSNTGFVINGGNFSSQLWALPNSLGDWHQVGDHVVAGATGPGAYSCLPAEIAADDDPSCLPEQSIEGAFVVNDPDPSNPVGRNDPAGAGTTCSAYAASLATNRWADDPARDDDFGDLCCGPIRHLCGLPLCPIIPGGVTQTWSDEAGETAMNVRSQPTEVTGHVTVRIGTELVRREIPNCVAFPMPSQCCAP